MLGEGNQGMVKYCVIVFGQNGHMNYTITDLNVLSLRRGFGNVREGAVRH